MYNGNFLIINDQRENSNDDFTMEQYVFPFYPIKLKGKGILFNACFIQPF